MQTDPTLLPNNTQHFCAQQCCDLLRPFAWNHNNVGTCCVKFETGQTFRPMQTDATLLANNTQQCWELLALVAAVCMGLNYYQLSQWKTFYHQYTCRVVNQMILSDGVTKFLDLGQRVVGKSKRPRNQAELGATNTLRTTNCNFSWLNK